MTLSFNLLTVGSIRVVHGLGQPMDWVRLDWVGSRFFVGWVGSWIHIITDRSRLSAGKLYHFNLFAEVCVLALCDTC